MTITMGQVDGRRLEIPTTLEMEMEAGMVTISIHDRHHMMKGGLPSLAAA